MEKVIIIKLIVLKKQKQKRGRERDTNAQIHYTHSDSSQKPLRHISYNDANEENDGLQPRVSQDEWQDEETDSQEYSHTSDDVDEMLDLDADGCPADLQLRCQSGDATHHRSVTGGYHNATSCTCSRGSLNLNQSFCLPQRDITDKTSSM